MDSEGSGTTLRRQSSRFAGMHRTFSLPRWGRRATETSYIPLQGSEGSGENVEKEVYESPLLARIKSAVLGTSLRVRIVGAVVLGFVVLALSWGLVVVCNFPDSYNMDLK